MWGETALLRWLRGGTIAHDRSGRLAAAHTEDATGVLPETGGAWSPEAPARALAFWAELLR